MRRHNESRMQAACVRWFRYTHPELAHLLIAVPNGVATSETQGRILKDEGMVAGVADLLLLVPGNGGTLLAIEMKTETGRQSDSQKHWQQVAEAHGIRYEVCRSFEQFETIINDYLHGRN